MESEATMSTQPPASNIANRSCAEGEIAAITGIEQLASLPPVQGALDQILHRFGADLRASCPPWTASFDVEPLIENACGRGASISSLVAFPISRGRACG